MESELKQLQYQTIFRDTANEEIASIVPHIYCKSATCLDLRNIKQTGVCNLQQMIPKTEVIGILHNSACIKIALEYQHV